MEEFKKCCLDNQLDKAKRLYSMHNPEDVKLDDIFYDLFTELCNDGDLYVAKWLCDIYCEKHKDYNPYNELFRYCCKRGNIKLAKLLYESYVIDIYERDPSELFGRGDAFEYACIFDNLEIAQWLYDISDKDKLYTQECIKSMFTLVASNDLKMLQWIYTLNEHDNEDLVSAFGVATCINGKLDNAKWIYSLKIIINEDTINHIFVESCVRGHLDVAKWLYYELDDVNIHIDIHHQSLNSNKETNYAFIWSLYMDHLDVAQWLYNLDGNINIRTQNDKIFKYICSKSRCNFNRINIVKWLCTLCNNYSVDVHDNKIINYAITD